MLRLRPKAGWGLSSWSSPSRLMRSRMVVSPGRWFSGGGGVVKRGRRRSRRIAGRTWPGVSAGCWVAGGPACGIGAGADGGAAYGLILAGGWFGWSGRWNSGGWVMLTYLIMGRGRMKSIGGAGWPGGEHPGEFRLLGVPVFEFQHEVGEFCPGFRNNVIRYLNGLFFRHV